MTIATKYSIGQEVWFMRNNKPESNFIFSVEPVVAAINHRAVVTRTDIRYRFDDRGNLYNEADVFESKEALLKSL